MILTRAWPSSAYTRTHILPFTIRKSTSLQVRSFLSSAAETIHATKKLPYPRRALFEIIADVKSYPHFLPFCSDASILGWSQPDSHGKRWPASAELAVGWGALNENYISRIYCVPDQKVESLAGDAHSLLSPEDRKLYHGMSQIHPGNGGEIFKSLRSTWTLHDVGREDHPDGTNVELEIAFEFQNPLYATLASAAIPKVAGTIMEAFERRTRAVLSMKKS